MTPGGADVIVAAPLRGRAAALSAVPDPVFADRMMGDGIAVHPLDDTVRAPFDGVVVTLHEAGHAVSLRHDSGVELLIHVGLDTVMLKGTGFAPLVAVGDRVMRGDALIRFDLDAVALGATSLVTPIVVTSGTILARVERGMIEVGDTILTLAPAIGARPVSHDGDVVRADVKLALAHGIHARPAARVGECARRFNADVTLVLDGRRGDARSPVALLALGTRHGDTVGVEARGPEAPAALAAIVALLETDMDDAPARSAPLAVQAAELEPGQIAGIIAAPGLAMGVAARLRNVDRAIEQVGAGIDTERAALTGALNTVRARIEHRASTGGTAAAVMQAHLSLLDDPALATAADQAIARGDSASFAWRSTIREQADLLRSTGNAHLIERIDDLLDLERQTLSVIAGETEGGARLPYGAIVVADDLMPSQLIALAAGSPAGIALARGGPTSHVAILCAGLGLPALVALGDALDDVTDGTPLLLDAEAARLTIAPAPDASEAFAERIDARAARRAAAHAAADQPCHTADGVRIEVFANVGSIADAEEAARNGAEGSGLVRSEFLFLDRADAPDEAEQRAAYQGIADALADRPVIVRLLDIGGDKPAAYLPIAAEENPALGLRGIRVGLAHPALLETQVRAILGVQPVGRCRIMIPMIASVAEVAAVRAIVERVRSELAITTPVEIGVMVETPAAAMTADLLAQAADFLSVGSNDLTQYVLAMDRGNAAVAAGIDALHPAVLRMIGETCRGAARFDRWVGLCGGLASDPAAVPILIGLGVSELSTVPGMVPETKAIVRALTLPAARAHAAAALTCTSAAEVRALAAHFAEGIA